MSRQPEMTAEEIAAVVVGSVLYGDGYRRTKYHVHAIVPGKYDNEDVVVLTYWSKRWQCWRYRVETNQSIPILFSFQPWKRDSNVEVVK